MKDEEIKIGDLVRVRQWNDMANEFEIDDDGDIYIPQKDTYFIEQMKNLCGKVLTVSNVYGLHGEIVYEFTENISWYLCSEMLEPYTDEELVPATDDELLNLLL